MRLACEGCDWVREADTAEELRAAMLAHGAEAHGQLWSGKGPDEVREMERAMDAHVREMIAAQN